MGVPTHDFLLYDVFKLFFDFILFYFMFSLV